MVTSMGLVGTMACGTCAGAEPPPPFVPAYTSEQAMAKLLRSPCGKVLEGLAVLDHDLEGHEGPEGRREVILRFQVALPSPRLGISYRVSACANMDPDTGEVQNAEAKARDLRTAIETARAWISAAEASPEVVRFVADHPPASRIRAKVEWYAGTNGGISYVATQPDGRPETLLWPAPDSAVFREP